MLLADFCDPSEGRAGGSTAKRRRAGVRPHPHAVLRDPVELDQTLVYRPRHALGQQPVRQFPMSHTEVRQRVVIRRHAASRRRSQDWRRELHRDELLADWALAAEGNQPYKIEPLR